MSSISPPHCSKVATHPSSWVRAYSGLQWSKPSLPKNLGENGGWEKKLKLCLLPVVLVKEGTILWLVNEMTQVRSQKLFQRGLRKEKAGSIPEVLKKYLERCQSSSLNSHGGPSAMGK